MGMNINPNGLKTFAQMGVQPQFYITTQTAPAQTAVNTQFQQPAALQQPQLQSPVQTPMQSPVQSQITTPIQTTQALQQPMPINTNLQYTPQADVAELSNKKPGKKKLIAGLGILAAAVVAGAIIFKGIKSGKNPMPEDIQTANQAAKALTQNATALMQEADRFKSEGLSIAQKANSLSDEITDMTANAQRSIDNVIALFTQGEEKTADGSSFVRKIIHDIQANIDTMEEYAQDGTTLLRKSTMKNGSPQLIEEFCNGKSNLIKTTAKGKLTSYKTGVETLANGDERIEKILTFVNGKPNKYEKDVLVQNNIVTSIGQSLKLHADLPQTYMEGFSRASINGKNIETTAKTIEYDKSGAILQYKENVETQGSILKIAKKFDFRKNKYQEGYIADYDKKTETRNKVLFIANDKMQKYEENVVCLDDKPVEISGSVSFENDKPTRYEQSFKKLNDGTEETSVVIEYTNGEPVKFVQNLQIAPGDKETSDKILQLIDETWQEINMQSAQTA